MWHLFRHVSEQIGRHWVVQPGGVDRPSTRVQNFHRIFQMLGFLQIF